MPVNSESERLSKQLLALYRAVDAQQPEQQLSAHLQRFSEAVHVAIWSPLAELCWGVHLAPLSSTMVPQIKALLDRQGNLEPQAEPHGLGVTSIPAVSGQTGADHPVVVSPLKHSAGLSIIWIGSPDDEHFERHVAALLALLRPHLEHIFEELAHRSTHLSKSLDALQVGLFSYVRGVMSPANASANTLLTSSEVLRRRGDEVQVVDSATARALLQCIQEVCALEEAGAEVVVLPRGDERHDLLAVVTRVGIGDVTDACWIMVHDPEHVRGIELPQGLYGLSPAERAVAKWMLQGCTAPEVGNILKVSPWTVRTHLKNIFVKTGTNRQSELVALLAPLLLLFRQSAD
ncbi:MAG: helix-turn-helix transcriptional regulator [Bradymonadia bacterium]